MNFITLTSFPRAATIEPIKPSHNPDVENVMIKMIEQVAATHNEKTSSSSSSFSRFRIEVESASEFQNQIGRKALKFFIDFKGSAPKFLRNFALFETQAGNLYLILQFQASEIEAVPRIFPASLLPYSDITPDGVYITSDLKKVKGCWEIIKNLKQFYISDENIKKGDDFIRQRASQSVRKNSPIQNPALASTFQLEDDSSLEPLNPKPIPQEELNFLRSISRVGFLITSSLRIHLEPIDYRSSLEDLYEVSGSSETIKKSLAPQNKTDEIQKE